MNNVYHLQASWDNGTDQNTSLNPNAGFQDRNRVLSVGNVPQDDGFSTIFRVYAQTPDGTNDAAAIRGVGANNGAGVVGHGGSSGAGVIGIGGGEYLPGVVGLAADMRSGVPLGTGDGSGVQGHAQRLNSYGVYGQNEHGTGTYGYSKRGFGAEAVSADSTALSALSWNGTAIYATTKATEEAGESLAAIEADGGQAVGVRGSSFGNHGIVGQSVLGVGVHGIANVNDTPFGDRPGVLGEAIFGNGVEGTSRDGYGGQFGGGRAAVRLVPSNGVGPPPDGEHEMGELVLDSAGDLHLCVVATPVGGAATWKKVALI